jgi:hypothetical protein
VQQREHPAPRLAEHVVAPVDPQVRGERAELALEQRGRPERGVGVGQVVRVAVPELVVQHARPARALQRGKRLEVVVRRAGAAVAQDHGRPAGILVEVADDAIPGAMPVQQQVALHGGPPYTG